MALWAATLGFRVPLRWSTWSEPAGRFGHMVKCARPALGKFDAAAPAAFHSRPRWGYTPKLQAPSSSVHVVGGRGLDRTYGEVRAHLATDKVGVADRRAAFHPRGYR